MQQAEEIALEAQLGELQRTMHAMTEDPANRSRLYLTDREVRPVACLNRALQTLSALLMGMHLLSATYMLLQYSPAAQLKFCAVSKLQDTSLPDRVLKAKYRGLYVHA